MSNSTNDVCQFIVELGQDAYNMAKKNFHSSALVCNLYVSGAINTFFICTGYSTQEALENAYNGLDIFDKNIPFSDYLEDIVIVSTIRL